jgi:predicted acylesterase/phospholipase RssA
MTNDNTIYIGLTMAGAVSAGAYTAGVIDFLIEALDEWEKRKTEGKENTPSHRIEIPAFGGASAGGMTSIILASLVNEKFDHVALAPDNILQDIPSNKLYHSWVDLTDQDMFGRMLKEDDLKDGVKSLFNSNFIDEVADRLVVPGIGTQIKRNYFSDSLKIFVTLSNLKGFTYDLSFMADNKVQSKYFVERHNDFACFKLGNKKYDKDGWIPLSFKEGLNSRLAADAAMATGAFPIGLKARELTRETKYILDNDWLRIKGAKPNMLPLLKRTDQIVDGGMINNEPFEKVSELLHDKLLDEGIIKNNQIPTNNYKDFRSTVLMIDPFPATSSSFSDKDDILSIAGKTLSAMLGQVRTKPDDVIRTFQSDDSKQFMIAPSRFFPTYSTQGQIKKQGSMAIACGFFNGFGGFFNKEFRVHDFFLGRANCEYFLRNHFTVPVKAKNKIIEFGYKNVDKNLFYSTTDRDWALPIIPLFTKQKTIPYLPEFSCGGDWPKQNFRVVNNNYQKPIKNRVEDMIAELHIGKNGFQKFMLWLANRFYLRNKAAKSFLNIIKKDMAKHELLK